MPGDTPAPGDEPSRPATPPPLKLQVAQLVVIPAVIVLVCIGLALLFGVLAGAKDSIDTHLLKLRQSSGSGRLAMGLQDPRYKDRGLAAYNIATAIPHIKDTIERQRISQSLIEILKDRVAADEDILQAYLLMAIGQLGQQGGLPAITQRLGSPHPRVRQAAVAGILSWPDPSQAREAVPALQARLADDNPVVRTAAAAAVGKLGSARDPGLTQALHQAMEDTQGLAMREAHWNAAVALARLQDPVGSRYVAEVLLNRDTLKTLPAGESGPQLDQTITPAMADRVILATMISVGPLADTVVWDKIKEIADNDPNKLLRKTAEDLIHQKSKQLSGAAGTN